MTEYKLANELNQKIVDGIFEGYRDYLEVRREKARELKVSGAYAWVKGNHIDHHVALSCQSLGVESKLARAGLTWQYLQFKNDNENTLFIVKNARYFNKEQVSRGRDIHGKTRSTKISYMESLMEINSGIDFDHVPTIVSNFSDQLALELFEEARLTEKDNEDIAKVKSNYRKFYIVTYSVDEGQQIEKIGLWMPNPANNKAYLIDDLTPYITGAPTVDIDDELKDVLFSDSEVEHTFGAHMFDIGLDESEEKEK